MEFVRIGRLKDTLIRGPLSALDTAKYLGIHLADVHSETVDGRTEKA